MFQPVEIPLWLLLLILLFAAVTFASHFLFPSVRWFFRRRLERAVARLNKRLTRPIEPFKLARRHDMIQRLVYDPEVTEAIVAHARENRVPENVAFEQARRYAREIVPSFSAFAYFGFGIRAARWLANAVFDVRTGARNEEMLAKIPPEATVVFIMNHRSNMDYVLVTYLAAHASALSYAVGEWARVWPLSRLIKSMGAYFIRRKSRGALYRKVLARYVQMAAAGGVTQAIFPEGGLSLDGRLAPPKLGLLAYVIDGWKSSGRDLAFVPVAINYDRVLEDRVLVAANSRGDRRFNARFSVVVRVTLRKIWLRLRGQNVRFGHAAVVFGAPIQLLSGSETPDPDRLAKDLMARIRSQMPMLYVPVMCRVFLAADGPITEAELADAMHAAFDSVPHAPWLDPRDLFDDAFEQARRHLADRSMILPAEGGRWRANEDESVLLTYYANSVAHYFENAPAPTRHAARAKS